MNQFTNSSSQQCPKSSGFYNPNHNSQANTERSANSGHPVLNRAETLKNSSKPLSQDETASLMRRMLSASEPDKTHLRNEIVMGNISAIYGYVARFTRPGNSEYFQNTLSTAISAFIHYLVRLKETNIAMWWPDATQDISDAIRDEAIDLRDNEFGLTTNGVRKINFIRRMIARSGRPADEWSTEEIAKEAGITVKQAAYVSPYIMIPVRLNAPSKDEDADSSPISEFIKADEPAPDEILLKKNETRLLYEWAISQLSEQQLDVMSSLYGLNGREVQTLAEIGKRLNMTPQGVHFIANKAKLTLARKHAFRIQFMEKAGIQA